MFSKQKGFLKDYLNSDKRILITGGAGFIGGALVRKLLEESSLKIYNLDKLSYSSDLTSINQKLKKIGEKRNQDYYFMNLDLSNFKLTQEAIQNADPDLIFHLAAESHVDRSIDNPEIFIQSNVIGTFNILQSSLEHFRRLEPKRKSNFRFHHVSTDEVFGSLDKNKFFTEETKYDPRSPYSASKASSDHLVKAWHHTYDLPVSISNCSNNYGPWQFPEKLIPLVIDKALNEENIPIYGDGENIRDWLYVEDHIDALLEISVLGKNGKDYCIGGNNQLTNNEIAAIICDYLDKYFKKDFSHKKLIKFVDDRPGHDRRYAIKPDYIFKELGWKPKYKFKEGIKKTVDWYINNIDWCREIKKKSGYTGNRLGNF